VDLFSIGFSAARYWWHEREKTRENVTRRQRGEGVGININIIALIALDRGDARTYDTLQITRRESAAERAAQRVSEKRSEERRERGLVMSVA